MRANLPSYEMRTVGTLEECLGLLAREPGVWKPFAGGTDLMVLVEAGKLPHRKYVSLWGLGELCGIAETRDHVIIGTLATYSDVQRNATIALEFPMLVTAARGTGSIATQNRGTLGGNIVNASPAADSPPALLCYDAELELVSTNGARWVPYHGFHAGYKQVNLRPDEIVSKIRLPRTSANRKHYFRKVGTRKAQAISKVCFAGVTEINVGKLKNVRIAMGSVAPVPLRCVKTEAALEGKSAGAETLAEAQEALTKEIAPIDDIRSTARYRMRVAVNLLEEFLRVASKKI